MAYYKSLDNQNWLLPPNIKDMVPEGHICFLVETVVRMVDYSSFDERYSGPGHPAYHPKVVLKLLLQGMLDRVRSSRSIARNARENVVYMYLAEKLQPDFRTISDFRKDNPEVIKELFKTIVTLAKEAGMVGLAHLSPDGTKIKANANSYSFVKPEGLELLEKFIEEEIEAGVEVDREEDELYGTRRGPDELPESLDSQEKIASTVRKYMKRIKGTGKEKGKRMLEKEIHNAKDEVSKSELGRVSLTDPECRFMKNKKGKIEPSYNAQVTTDSKYNIIVANDVCQDEFDNGQLVPQLESAEENVGRLEKGTKVSADNGYFKGENLKYLEDRKFDGYIPDEVAAQEYKGNEVILQKYDRRNFEYNSSKDEFICPHGQRLVLKSRYFEKCKGKMRYIYKGIGCQNCKHKIECTKSKKGVRAISTLGFTNEIRDMAAKMQTKEAKETYKTRSRTVEPAIGTLKQDFGFREFLTRGVKTVRSEFNLVCAAYDLKKLWILLQNPVGLV